MFSLQGESKACLKCGHTRTSSDSGPDYACPKCGAIYAKLEAAQRAKHAALTEDEARRQERIEEAAWQREHADELRQQRAKEGSQKKIAHLVYVLFVLPVGLTALIGVVIAHLMNSSRNDTWVDSHFKWQIATFWRAVVSLLVIWAIGYIVLGGTLLLYATKGTGSAVLGGLGAGAILKVVLVLLSVWCIYRVVKGWFCLFRGEEV